ncbi:ribosome bioproteinsis protein ytm1 [Rhodotorula kratochvilovae]
MSADLLQPVASTSTASIAGADGADEKQIAIRLSTKDPLYTIPPAKFLVPASWRRFHLSELINKVLENESPIPFDFLIDQTLLRSSLGAYCAATGTSEEVVLEVEFLPSTLPPQLESTLPSEDWVSDVSVAVRGAILTASYAGTLSLQSNDLPAGTSLTFVGHDLSALSTTYVPVPLGSEDKRWVASGGLDRVGRVWEYSIPPLSLDAEPTVPAPTCLYTLSLHQAPISSVRSRPLPLTSTTPTSAPHLLTAGWDGLIGLWDLTPGANEGEVELEGADRKKKRRRQSTTVVNKSPSAVLRGHTGKISRAVFDRSDMTKAYSAGWDHSVRSWDLSVGEETSSKTSDKVLLAMAQLTAPNLLATGSTDRLICLWDLRTDATQNISLTLAGHSAPVSAVAAHPTSSLLFASGSYDSTVRIWDARSPKQALFTLPVPKKEGEERKEPEKVLAIDWDGERLVAGGEGSRTIVWRVSGQESQAPAAQ